MFVERLKSLRAEKGISQSTLSDYMGVTQQAIAKWETDKATPDPDALKKLASFFHVSVDYLVGKSDAKNSAEEKLPLILKVLSEMNLNEKQKKAYEKLLSMDQDEKLSNLREAMDLFEKYKSLSSEERQAVSKVIELFSRR